MASILTDKKIVLGVTGGIAAYKSVELLRLLKKQGADVRVIMTPNAKWFVGPMTFEALSGHPVFSDLFAQQSDAAMRHIDWAEQADGVVIAPATANVIGKLANGIADDALSTFMLAVTAPVVICPAMNVHMYDNRVVQRNIDTLEADGRLIVTPGSGELACGTTGPGRLAEPESILDRIVYRLTSKDLKGRRIVVTAGPTREPIDPVRYISNHSSGKMGYAVARAAEHRGAAVTLITGPSALPMPQHMTVVSVQTAAEMAEAVDDHFDDAEIIIKSAAVSDYRPVNPADHKLKKDRDDMQIHLEKNPDILLELGRRKKNQILIGFAAETQSLVENAASKLARKNLDMIVANIVGKPGTGFNADTNQVTFLFSDGTKKMLPMMEKENVAHTLLDEIVVRLASEK
ncbi:MAG: bifunctional phosphopantothenoylcysteine decarboxylase/phosphopantothenate--cysteine ligase CoaBC [Deltaproteobacteria bacterium]|nr:bifunctional phosphopantothenoylcysteine decarboxylase/phosphopantothenate--cysteine ligase CoaBC [Deltaproteobacteria bacterium]